MTFGVISIAVTIILYRLGTLCSKKFGVLANSIAIAMFGIIAIILLFDVPLDKYNVGGNIISFFITPATVVLALPLYKNIHLVKKYFPLIILSSFTGVFTSTGVVVIMTKVMNIDVSIMNSLIPKTVTTAIAIPVSENLLGIVSLTVVCVILTGIVGAVFGPIVFRLLKVEQSMIQGIVLGTSSHAIGTAKATEFSEVAAAFSSVSLIMTGMVLTFVTMFF